MKKSVKISLLTFLAIISYVIIVTMSVSIGGIITIILGTYGSYRLYFKNEKFKTKKMFIKIISGVIISFLIFYFGVGFAFMTKESIATNKQVAIENQIKVAEQEELGKQERIKTEIEAQKSAEEKKIADEKKKVEDDLAEKKQLEEKKVADEKEALAKAESDRVAQEKKKVEDEENRVRTEKYLADIKEKERVKYDTGLTFEDLARNPDNNKSKLVKFTGKVIQVMKGSGYSQYRLAVNSDYEQIILIEITDAQLTNGNVLENDVIAIKGVSMGTMSYKTVLGAEMTVPAVRVDSFSF